MTYINPANASQAVPVPGQNSIRLASTQRASADDGGVRTNPDLMGLSQASNDFGSLIATLSGDKNNATKLEAAGELVSKYSPQSFIPVRKFLASILANSSATTEDLQKAIALAGRIGNEQTLESLKPLLENEQLTELVQTSINTINSRLAAQLEAEDQLFSMP